MNTNYDNQIVYHLISIVNRSKDEYLETGALSSKTYPTNSWPIPPKGIARRRLGIVKFMYMNTEQTYGCNSFHLTEKLKLRI
jgi:hypothetical protein